MSQEHDQSIHQPQPKQKDGDKGIKISSLFEENILPIQFHN
jgi:hypothetical protein